MAIPTTTMKATKACPFCGEVGSVQLTQEQELQYQRWDSGGRREFIQDGLWSWTPEMREMLITGVDPKCWNDQIPLDDEEDE